MAIVEGETGLFRYGLHWNLFIVVSSVILHSSMPDPLEIRRDFIIEHDVDILAITETWLCDNDFDDFFLL